MGPVTTMTDWLAGLGENRLSALVRLRDDALLPPQPRTLDELAARLQHPASLADTLQRLPLPCAQLCEAIAALGAPAMRADLVAFLGSDDATVEGWLAVLAEHGVVWPGTDDTVFSPPTLNRLFGNPLSLGPTLEVLVADVPVATLRSILTTIGVPKPPTRRADVLAEVDRVLRDPHLVRDLVATAPLKIGEVLRTWAWDDEEGGYDQASAQARIEAGRWAVARGLVFGGQWSYSWQMPAEVARALRGPDYQAPFDPTPPAVPVTVLDPTDLASQAAGTVGQFAELTLTLADRIARAPLPMLKSGGVGTRELAKLAKESGCTDLQARLVLEVCAEAGVLTPSGHRWTLGEQGQHWRALAPAERVAPLLLAWWRLPLTPGESRDQDGKSVPALTGRACEGCRRARQAVLGTLAELGEGSSAAAGPLALRTLWRAPFVHVLAWDGSDAFGTHLAEATALGVVASGALTRLGTAVLVEDADELRGLLERMLPKAGTSALFGADLTAVVPGAPVAAVARLLDAAADREGRGGATVWRFSTGSVRRALDAGRSATALAHELSEISNGGELPQPLRYLIDDIGRQHGNLRVAPATSVIRSDDEALLVQVAADRSLRALQLRLIAPTVVVAGADTDAVLTRLRAAGYLPMPEADATGTDEPGPTQHAAGLPERDDESDDLDAELLHTLRQWSRDAGPDGAPHVPEAVDAAALTARLLDNPSGSHPPVTATERGLAAARSLSTEEIRMLAHAIDAAAAVGIEYRSQSGALTRREISQPLLMGDTIVAWCHLRDDERYFRIERVCSVFPIG